MKTGVGSCAGLGQDDETAYYCSDLLGNCNNLAPPNVQKNKFGLDYNQGGRGIQCWDPLLGTASTACTSAQWKCSVWKANISFVFSFFFNIFHFSFVKTVLSTGKGACTGATTELSSACGPHKFNLYYLLNANNVFWVNSNLATTLQANSDLNSYCNAFNLPSSFIKTYPAYNLIYKPKNCYDPSTRATLVCSVNDWQCLVKRDFL